MDTPIAARLILSLLALGFLWAEPAVNEIEDPCKLEGHFRCDEHQCVGNDVSCNGVSECLNGVDESIAVCGCPVGEFQCNSTVCIDMVRRCDTWRDCEDGSDEMDCETHSCLRSQFKCNNDFCVPRGHQCNFRDDCGDNSDEASCAYRGCYGTEWQCDNAQCILSSYLCDGNEDCEDGSDESRCDEHIQCANGLYVSESHGCDGWTDCIHSQDDELNCGACTQTQYQCNNGRCIRASNHCDGVCDCDVTCDDELSCSGVPCVGPGVFLCRGSGRCIQAQYVCDGHNDCWDSLAGHDEYHCVADDHECPPPGVLCAEGVCVGADYLCDHFPQCIDGREAENCPDKPPCAPETQFACRSGQCVDVTARCDGVNHCHDMSDETHCATFACPPGRMRCARSGQCLPPSLWCDFRRDCLDGSDEVDCDRKSCREEEFRCNNGQCVPRDHVCISGYTAEGLRLGCIDNSHLIPCRDFSCGAGLFKCQNSYCIEEARVCDQMPDCNATLTDELNCSQPCPYPSSNCTCLDEVMDCRGRRLEDVPDTSHELGLYKYLLGGNLLNTTLGPNTFDRHLDVVYLDISNNSLTSIGRGYFMGLWRLNTLNLADNHLTVLQNGSFLGLAGLNSLYLDGNGIQRIEPFAFIGLSSLKALDLSHEHLLHIEMNTFVGLRNIYKLNLSHNHLTFIPNGAFNGLQSMKHLDVSHNEVALIEESVFHGMPSLSVLYTDEFRFCCLARTVAACLPEPDEFSSCEDLMSNHVLRVCIWVLGLIALLGNTMVIIWRMRDTRDGKVHSFLITNLAVGDLLMGVYLLIIASADLKFRGFYIVYDTFWRQSGVCKLAGFLSTYSSELSVLTLTVITMDRFFSIIFPFRIKRLGFREARIVMAGLWILVLVLAAIPLADIDYFSHFYGRSGVCLALHITPAKPPGWEYSVFIFLALNLLSFFIIFVSYVWMFVVARRTRAAARSPQMKSDHAMARRMTLIVLTDFCCWVPIIALGVVSLCGTQIAPQVFAWIAVFVLPLNAAVNPILYTLSTASFLAPARKKAYKFRKSFITSLNPDTRATNLSQTDDKSYHSTSDYVSHSHHVTKGPGPSDRMLMETYPAAAHNGRCARAAGQHRTIPLLVVNDCSKPERLADCDYESDS